MFSLTAKPRFEGDDPQIEYATNTAEITWSVNNLGSVTHILIDVCISDSAVCGTTVNITSPEIQPYIVPLPEGEAKGYVFIFFLYDVMDIVRKQVQAGARRYLYRYAGILEKPQLHRT